MFDINTLPTDIHGVILSNLLSSVEYRLEDGKEYMTNTGTLRALLGYAKLGPNPHCEVLKALQFTVATWNCSDLPKYLILQFSTSLREIDLSHAVPVMFPNMTPKLPNLCKAKLSATSNQLELIRHSPGLQHLSVSLNFSSEWDVFVATIASYQLKTLDMSYESRYGEKLHNRDWNMMGLEAPCQTLWHLTLSGRTTLTGSVRLLVCTLQHLTKLTLNVKLYNYNVEDLKDFPYLEIMDGFGSSFSATEKLKSSVRSLGGNVGTRENILALASFPELSHLKIVARKNLGDALMAVLPNLESLSVGFAFCLSLFRGRPYPSYRRLDAASFISSLEHSRKLSFLCMDKMLVSASDIKKILEVIGMNLKEFHICIDWQREKAANRIEVILKSVAQFCPNLHVLRFLEDFSGTVPSITASEEQKLGCLHALALICKAAPRFSSYSKILSIILNRFKDKRNEREVTWDLVFPPYK